MQQPVILFDLDGTLIDSLPDLTDALNHMLAHFARPSLTPTDVRQLVGKGVRNLVQRALASVSEQEIDLGIELFVAYNSAHIADKSRLYPGMLETLTELAAANIPMAVISNKQEALCCLILEALGIAQLFDCVCGGDTVAEMKPSPLPLQHVLACLDKGIHEAIMVGDSINDIQAGQRAGITTIGCCWGYGTAAELRGADQLAASPRELAALLLGNIS